MKSKELEPATKIPEILAFPWLATTYQVLIIMFHSFCAAILEL